MIARFHHSKHFAELLEVLLLLGFQRVHDEEWDDVIREVLPAADSIRPSVAMVRSHDTTVEVFTNCSKELHIAFVLHDGELREYLITASHVGVRIDADVEAAFTVHEACYPSCV